MQRLRNQEFQVLGPALVHLFLEVHPMYYRGVKGYDPVKQSNTAHRMFQELLEALPDQLPDSPADREQVVATSVESWFSRPEVQNLLQLFRPRFWWKQEQGKTYSIPESIRIISNEDANWYAGKLVPQVRDVLEQLLQKAVQTPEPDEEREWIQEDWRQIFLVKPPLTNKEKTAFLNAISEFTPDDVHRLLFRGFREMPELGERLALLVDGFSENERMQLLNASPLFIMYMHEVSEPVFSAFLEKYPFKTIEESFEILKKKNMVPDDLVRFWERDMPYAWQDRLLEKMFKEEPVLHQRVGLNWIGTPGITGSDPAVSRNLDLFRRSLINQNKVSANPAQYLRAKKISSSDRLVAVLCNGKNIKHIDPQHFTPEMLSLAVEGPCPGTAKRWARKMGVKTQQIPASGLSYIPEEYATPEYIEKALRYDPNNFTGVPQKDRVQWVETVLEESVRQHRHLDEVTMEALVRTEVSPSLLVKIVLHDPTVLDIMDWTKAPTLKFHPEQLPEFTKQLLQKFRGDFPLLSKVKPESVLNQWPDALLELAISQHPENCRFIPEHRRTLKMEQMAIGYSENHHTLSMLGATSVELSHWKLAVQKNPDNLLEMRNILGGHWPAEEIRLEAALFHPDSTAKILRYASPEDMFAKLHSQKLADEYANVAGHPHATQMLKDWIEKERIREAEAAMQAKPNVQVVVNGGQVQVGDNNTQNAATKEEEKGLWASLSGLKKAVVGVALGVAIVMGTHAYDPEILPKPLATVATSSLAFVQQKFHSEAPGVSFRNSLERILATALQKPNLDMESSLALQMKVDLMSIQKFCEDDQMGCMELVTGHLDNHPDPRVRHNEKLRRVIFPHLMGEEGHAATPEDILKSVSPKSLVSLPMEKIDFTPVGT